MLDFRACVGIDRVRLYLSFTSILSVAVINDFVTNESDLTKVVATFGDCAKESVCAVLGQDLIFIEVFHIVIIPPFVSFLANHKQVLNISDKPIITCLESKFVNNQRQIEVVQEEAHFLKDSYVIVGELDTDVAVCLRVLD